MSDLQLRGRAWWLLAVASLMLAGCGTPRPSSLTPFPGQTTTLQETGPPLGQTLLRYLPNRGADLLDIASVGVALPSASILFPSTVHLNVHLTRAFEIGAGETKGVFYGRSCARRLEWGFEQTELSLGPYTDTRIIFSPVAGRPELDRRVDCAGMLSPSDAPFAKDCLDYWALGAHIGVFPIALSLDIHPVEIADALLGFFLIDIRHDDR